MYTIRHELRHARWAWSSRPMGACYITVYSATTALQNGACTYRCISKQILYKTLFSHNSYMKSLEIYENYITLSCLEKNSELCMAYYPK